MPKVQIDTRAPDFELPRFDGGIARLSDLIRNQHVVLVFNRGFT
jgi:peroxiredoxin